MGNSSRYWSFGLSVATAITLNLVNPPPAEAAIFSVDTTAELQSALGNAQAGDTVLVAPGTYHATTSTSVGAKSAYFHAGADGTASSPITIRSQDPSDAAVLKGGDIADGGYTLYVTGDYWRVEDIHITHGQKGLVLDNANHNHIVGVQVYHVGQEAIHIRDGSSDNLIEDSYVNDTGATLTDRDMGFGEGIYIGSDRSVWEVNEGTSGSNADPGYGYARNTNNNIIRNNVVGSLVRAEPIDLKEGASGTLIEDNTLLGGGISGVHYADSFIDVKSYNTTIQNNVGYKQGNPEISRNIHEIDRTSSNPWCPAHETSNSDLSDTSDGNVYSNNVFHEGNPPGDVEPGEPEDSSVTASGWQVGNGPENTIDKDLTTRWSREGSGEWIQYDLGAEQSVSSVEIAFYQGDQRTADFDVQVSDDGNAFTTVLSATSSGNSLQLESFDFTDTTARYVRIVGYGNSSNNWNSYTEVEISSGGDGSGSDTQAPTAPTGLSASAQSSSQIDLNWSASSDDVGVDHYEIYRGQTLAGTSTSTSFSDIGLSPSTTYSYTVRAKDAAGNTSSASLSSSATTLAGSAPPSSLAAHYQEGDGGDDTDSDIRPYFKVVNNGSSSIALEDVTIRYFYKRESSSAQNATVDYATLGNAEVTVTTGSLATSSATADAYLEVGFTAGAGDLAAGGDTGKIKTRINNDDWSSYDESNDYSYNPNYTSFSEYDRVAVYLNGTLVWGSEP